MVLLLERSAEKTEQSESSLYPAGPKQNQTCSVTKTGLAIPKITAGDTGLEMILGSSKKEYVPAHVQICVWTPSLAVYLKCTNMKKILKKIIL